MTNSLKLILGLILLVIVGGFVFKAISVIITLAIVATVGYFVIQWAFPTLLEKPQEENKEPLSPLEKYKDRL